MDLIQRISLIWKRLTPLEEFLLKEFLNQTYPEAKRVTELQINSITKTSRYLKWNEILFYRKKIDGIERYPNLQEIVLVKIIFRPKGNKKKWIARIYSVQGYLFSIHINPSPKKISFMKDYELIALTLVDNPMNPMDYSYLEKLYKRLPVELVQLEGQVVNNWIIFRKEEVYGISFDTGELFCVAERNDEYLCISIENERNKFYYLESHESEPKAVERDVIEFFYNK